MRHPWVLHELAGRDPISDERTLWPGGHSLRFRAFLGEHVVPDELITSVRCVVIRGDAVLVCEDSHPAIHVWPGGRREPGESLEDTAVREVWEETGWTLDPATLVRIGFVHFEHLTPMPEDHPFPMPDFVQLVLCGSGVVGPEGWHDTDRGYVERSYLAERRTLASLPITHAERQFLEAAFALSQS